MDPSDPNRLYAAATVPSDDPVPGLWRSDDGAAHWTRIGAGEIHRVAAIDIAGDGRLYVVSNREPGGGGYFSDRVLLRSDDHGESWTRLNERRATAVGVHPKDPDRVYLMTFAGDVETEPVNVFRSLDGGETWTAIADDIALTPGGRYNRIEFDPHDPRRLFVLHNSGVYEGIDND